MADDGPPKPKPGSLKDRIKQFEASSSAQASTPAPPPLRPKPGTLSQWKPKPIDPPSPSKQTAFPTDNEDSESPVKYGQSGMSATDAVSSIAQGGGSLKERMAALQGKGAFGNAGAASNAPPLPSNEGKPRVWKTSKAPLPERKDEVPSVGNEDATTPTREHPSNADAITSPKESSSQDNIPEVRETNTEEGGEGETAGTEEDEERERRAAIAARMARLGGARLGMPVGFGVATKGLHSPSKPKIVSPGDEDSNADPSSSVVSPTDSQKDAPAPKPRTTLDTALAVPLPTSQGSLLSPGEVSDLPSDSDAASSRKLLPPRSPSAPVPALPKRAAGPRKKKSGKETAVAATSSTDSETVSVPVPSLTESTTEDETKVPDTAEATSITADEHVTEPAPIKADDTSKDTDSSQPSPPEAQEKKQPSVDEIALIVPPKSAAPSAASPSMLTPADDFEDPDKSIEYPPERPTIQIPSAEKDEDQDGSPLTPRPEDEPNKKISVSTSVSQVPELVRSSEDDEKSEELDEEQEEALRKQRIAEKMARLGAVNPLSPGGFISPVSPHSTEKSKDESEGYEYEVEERSEDSEGLKATDSAKTSNVDDESKANVSVLSSVLSSQAHDAESEIYSPVAESSLQSPYTSEQGEAMFNDSMAPPSDAAADQEGSDEDADVDYPMLSPVEGAESGTHMPSSMNTLEGEVQPREKGAARSSSQHGDDEDKKFDSKALPPEPKTESEKPNLDLQTSQLSLDQEEAHEDHPQEQSNMPPRRITRAIPPPPPRSGSSASVSPLNSPSRIGFDTPSGSVLAAALSRQAPPPPNRSSATPPPRSVSPTPSPPRRLFVREGAPSPPSLRSLSNGGDEEDSDERSGYHSNEPNSPPPEDLRKRSASPEPIHSIDEEVVTSSPQTTPIPPPLPSGRPPVPNVRRSIPPPPRKSIPNPPRAMSKEDQSTPEAQSPIVVPTIPSTPQGRKSTGSTRQKSQDGSHDETLQSSIRQAAFRPPLPPPSRDAEKEIMDEEDGDPVDPQFVPNKKPSPVPSSANAPVPRKSLSKPESSVNAPVPRRSVPKPEETEKESVANNQASTSDNDVEEDAETARRRTIAERMAKLGGIRFGMAPPIRPPAGRKPQETAEERSEEEKNATEKREETHEGEGATEEDERSRRAAIAARMAAMGGLGFGMYGPGAVPATSTVASSKVSQSPPTHAPRAPLAAPPPIPGARPKQKSQEEEISEATSRAPPPLPSSSSQIVSDDVLVEDTSESEIEMVNADIEDEGEIVEREEEEPEIVETPPPPPTRIGRTVAAVTRPPPPPPVPVNEEIDNPGPSSAASSTQPAKRSAPSRSIPVPASPPSEYEVVGEESSSSKGGHTHAHQSGNTDPKVPAALESSGQWELPNIPSGSFDLGPYGKSKAAVEPDHSWTQVEQEQPAVSAPSKGKRPASNAPRPFSGPAPPPVPNDELALLAYTLGSRIVASAHNVCEQSRRAPIGDGSSLAFLLAVVTGAGASTTSLGHLVYAQTGGTVQKRLGDIMPGDIVALYDARFKGHKGGLGLGGYSSSWGTRDEPALAVVSEFEGKKSKIKAYAVNQHPSSAPSIDIPSYKLEDLKSGVVKVFRMTEAEQ